MERALLFSFLGWGPWSCWADARNEEPPLAAESSPWASVAPCVRAGTKMTPLSPSLDTLPGRFGASPSPSKGARAGHTPGLAECVPSLSTSQAMLEEGEAERPRGPGWSQPRNDHPCRAPPPPWAAIPKEPLLQEKGPRWQPAVIKPSQKRLLAAKRKCLDHGE